MTEGSAGEALGGALSGIMRWMTRPEVSRSLSGGLDVTPTDAWLLGRLFEAGPSRLSQLAEWQGIDRSTMTAHVRRLEQRGLIERGHDPSDGRAVVVSISDSGREAHERGHRAAVEVIDGLVGAWPARDRRELVRLLTKFTREVSARAPTA